MATRSIDALVEAVGSSLLPLRGVTVRLRASQPATIRFFHGHALSAWLRTLSPVDESRWYRDIRLDAPESSRIHYASGDEYHFTLYATSPGFATLVHLLDQLANPKPAQSAGLAFGTHWQLVSLNDAFNGDPISQANELCAYGVESWREEAAIWQSDAAHNFVWQWLSPARVLRDPGNRGEGEQRFCRDRDHITVALFFDRARDALAALLRDATGHAPARVAEEFPGGDVTFCTAFWMEDDYHPKQGRGKPKGGLLGQIHWHGPLPMAWAAVLVLGQYLGCGQGSASGMGRYRLKTHDGGYTLRRAHAVRDWLTLATTASNLRLAWQHVRSNRPSAAAQAESHIEDANDLHEDDGDTLDDWDNQHTAQDPALATSLAHTLERRVNALVDGRYHPPPARAAFLEKPDGSYRPLAVPPFWDAVLQRALAQPLSDALDSVMHPSSFGYRRGRSRKGAADAIQRARRQGYKWVFEADIEDFFGSVDHNNLHARLLALFDDDPVVDAIMAWVRAPVRWQGENYPRTRGLPQGSALSPVLANMMLDDFDNDMQAAGLKLVRFADDFVILCKDQARAQSAAKIAAQSLEEHSLFLKAAKSGVKPLADGLDFLGYLFVNDLALDLAGTRAPAARDATDPPPPDRDVHATHWLAKLSGTQPERFTEQQLLARDARTTLEQSAVKTVGEQLDANGTVQVVGAPCQLFTRGGRLVVQRDDTTVLERPWAHIQQLVLFGNHHLSTPALRAAADAGTTVHLASGFGRYQACVTNGRPEQGHRLWLSQAMLSEDPAFCLAAAQQLVAARLRHQHAVLRSRDAADRPQHLTRRLRACKAATSLAELNGIEGEAAAAYFAEFAKLVPDEFQFAHRARRPPPDPVNALLSLGYTALYNHADTLLRSVGLLPWLGVYHRAHGTHATLASDMIEPFRHLVERRVLALVRNGPITRDQFRTLSDGGCEIDATARRTFFADLSERLERPIRARGQSTAMSHTAHLNHQIMSLRDAIRTRDISAFTVFRLT